MGKIKEGRKIQGWGCVLAVLDKAIKSHLISNQAPFEWRFRYSNTGRTVGRALSRGTGSAKALRQKQGS